MEGDVGEGGISLSMNRDEGGVVRRSPEKHREPHLDALAKGMAEETIPRGRAIKLAGAALVGSALSLFVADAAGAHNRRRGRRGDESRRRRCRRRGGRFCEDRRDGTNRGGRCCRQPTSASRCRRGRCGGGRKRDRADEDVVNISGI